MQWTCQCGALNDLASPGPLTCPRCGVVTVPDVGWTAWLESAELQRRWVLDAPIVDLGAGATVTVRIDRPQVADVEARLIEAEDGRWRAASMTRPSEPRLVRDQDVLVVGGVSLRFCQQPFPRVDARRTSLRPAQSHAASAWFEWARAEQTLGTPLGWYLNARPQDRERSSIALSAALLHPFERRAAGTWNGFGFLTALQVSGELLLERWCCDVRRVPAVRFLHELVIDARAGELDACLEALRVMPLPPSLRELTFAAAAPRGRQQALVEALATRCPLLVPQSDLVEWLEVSERQANGAVSWRRVPLEKDRVLIGRGRHCDVVINDARVAREHCTFERRPSGVWRIVSINHQTWFAREKVLVREGTLLKDGDRLLVPVNEIVFRSAPTDAEAPAPENEERYRSDEGRVTVGLPPAASPPEGSFVRAFGGPAAAAPARPKDPLRAAWEQVWERPDDDGPRHLVADLLLERNDPRGELIALQLAEPGGPTGLAKGRLRELERHFREWVPPGVNPANAEFHRGFLVFADWVDETDAAHREWRTVERLRCTRHEGRDFYRGTLFASDALRRLRVLEGADAHAFQALCGGPRREQLEVLRTSVLPVDALLARLGALVDHLPRLGTLELAGTVVPPGALLLLEEALVAGAAVRGAQPLRRLVLTDAGGVTPLGEARALAGALDGLTVVLQPDLLPSCWLEFFSANVRLCRRRHVDLAALAMLSARAQQAGLTPQVVVVDDLS